jgi:cob(I)alamin adenosyltransferase
MADLCLSEKGPGGARLTVTDAQVEWLEQEIDRLNARS